MTVIYFITTIAENILIILEFFFIFKGIKRRQTDSKELFINEVILFFINTIQLPLEVYMDKADVFTYLVPCFWFINCLIELHNLNRSKQ